MFNEVYFPYLLDYRRRYEVYYGGAGSGKSVFVAQKLIVKALKSKRKILAIRKVGRTLKDSVFQLFIDTLKKFCIYDDCKINLTTYSITLPNGSIILCKGMDDSEKIKSIVDITDIWIEEATEINLDEFTQLDLRLRAMVDNLQMFCSFNPVSKLNWVYRKWFADGALVGNDTLILRTTYKDNNFLPAAYIKALEDKAKSNPNYYRVYTLGEFVTLDKLVFYNWKVEEFNHTEIKGQLLIGLDFGFVNDISAITASLLDEDNKKIYVFREWGDTGKTNEELANIIKALGFSKSVIIADSAEQKSIAEIKRAGITKIRAATKGKDSVIHGIQRLQNYEIIIHSSCEGIKTELENYTWKKDKATGEYTNEPIDLYNHYIDSLRYSLQCAAARVKTLDKNLF
jgi:phage terminase large subunit